MLLQMQIRDERCLAQAAFLMFATGTTDKAVVVRNRTARAEVG